MRRKDLAVTVIVTCLATAAALLRDHTLAVVLLLWLPSIGPSTGANVRIRVITSRDLFEHFDLIRATPIEGSSRPPQES